MIRTPRLLFTHTILICFAAGLLGCSGQLNPGALSSGETPTPAPSPTPAPTPGAGTGNTGDDEDGGGGNGGGLNEPPVITMISLQGGEFIGGGQTAKIYFSVHDASIGFNEVTVEYQRDGDINATFCAKEGNTCAFTGTKNIRYGAGTQWITKTLTDGTPCTNTVFTDPLPGTAKICQIVPDDPTSSWKLIADHVTTLSDVETFVEWPVCPQVDDDRCLGQTDGGGYRIRITAKGINNLTDTKVSQSTFSIDSTPPSLTNTGLAAKAGFPKNGFMQFILTGASDSMTAVSDVCVKTLDATVPLSSDSCWISLEAFGTAKSLTPSPITITQYLGFFNGNYTFYLWIRDSAGNMTTLTSNNSDAVGISKDKISVNYSFTTSPLWKDSGGDFQFSTDTTAVASLNTYTGVPGNNATTMADPGSIAMTSKGQMIVNDSVQGLVMVDLINRSRTVLVPLGVNTLEGTTGAGGTSRLKNPLHIGVDEDDWIWIQDEERLAFIDSTGALKIAAGGGSDINDNIANPLDLQITYHANMKWYGTFAVLPNKQVIFNSENPHAKLNPSTGPRYRLRVYNGKEGGRIDSIAFSGSYGTGTPISVNNLVPYGGMGFTYDTTRKFAKDIVGRFCNESGGTCIETLMIKFSAQGREPVLLNAHSSWSNVVLRGSLDTIYAFNSQRGLLSKLNLTSRTWSKVLGGSSRGTAYCADNIPSTSCSVRLTDVFVTKQNRLFFMDQARLRSVEMDGRVQTLYNGYFDQTNAANCKTLRNAGGQTVSGYYSIDPDGVGGANPYPVYCDMTTNGGGWTLVARSVSGGTGAFGWKTTTGDVTNDVAPFSMGLAANDLGFTELLFGSYSSEKTWSSSVYRWQGLPAGFMSTYSNSVYTPTPGSAPQAIVGGNTSFTMARYIGFTDLTTLYFFRDVAATASYGLGPSGWITAYANATGGNILGLQGMIFVR